MYETIQFHKLHESNTTAIGQCLPSIQYNSMEVTMAEITILPGQQTGWHFHPQGVRLFSFVEKGTLSMRYRSGEERVFSAGSAFIEAISVVHNGENRGEEPVILKVVMIQEAGGKLTVPADPE
jgi:quercetin dioxygenase-like cupin family protein